MPEPMVVDLSHYNTVTSFDSMMNAGIVGVIHKFSQGTSYRDPTYAQHKAEATSCGLLWGRYHFGDGSDPVRQVDNFLAGWTPDELLALDYEDNPDSQMLLGQARTFVQEVITRTGVVPVLYSGNTLKEALAVKGASAGVLLQCRLWLCQYGPNSVLPPGWSSYWLWQYTGTGRLPGTSGDVDLNTYQRGSDDLVAEWTGQPQPPQPQTRTVTVSIGVPEDVAVVVTVNDNVIG